MINYIKRYAKKNLYKASLTERVRQGEDSPILPFSDYYWNNSESENTVLRPVPEKKMKEPTVEEKERETETSSILYTVGLHF